MPVRSETRPDKLRMQYLNGIDGMVGSLSSSPDEGVWRERLERLTIVIQLIIGMSSNYPLDEIRRRLGKSFGKRLPTAEQPGLSFLLAAQDQLTNYLRNQEALPRSAGIGCLGIATKRMSRGGLP